MQPDAEDNLTDQDELIDVIGLHGNQHLDDDVINNRSTTPDAPSADLRMLYFHVI